MIAQSRPEAYGSRAADMSEELLAGNRSDFCTRLLAADVWCSHFQEIYSELMEGIMMENQRIVEARVLTGTILRLP